METPLGTKRLARLAWEAVGDFTGTNDIVTAGGVDFEYVGEGESRVVVLGPDKVVYKVPIWGDYQVDDELKLFRFGCLRRYCWAPDFWHYPDTNIVAMPLYRRYPLLGAMEIELQGGKWYRLQDEEAIKQLSRYSYDASRINVGLRDDDSLVLLDGGVSSIGN